MRVANWVSRNVVVVTTALAGTVTTGFAAWMPAPALNVPRAFAGAAVDSCGNILVVGGGQRVAGGAVQALSSIERLSYDGTNYANSWELLPTAMPVGRVGCGTIVVGNYLLVLGGTPPESGTALNTVDEFDLITQTWTPANTIPPMNLARHNFGNPVLDRFGRIWVVGGNTGAGQPETSRTEYFDLSQPTLGWQEGPSLTTARGDAGVVIDATGTIYAIGGIGNGAHLDSVERLGPDLCGSWQIGCALLPTPISNNNSAAALGVNGHIYVAGGWLPGYSARTVRLATPHSSCQWEGSAPLTTPRNALSLVLGANGLLYAIGGECCGNTSSGIVEVLATRSCSPGDLNGDGVVDLTDLARLLSTYGVSCP